MKGEYKDLTKDSIYLEIKQIWDKVNAGEIKHYEWEEDGKKYSAWKINTGKNTITTGDGGMELFNKELEKQVKNGIFKRNNE